MKASFVVHVSNTVMYSGLEVNGLCVFFGFGSWDLLIYVFQLTFSYCVQKLEHATWNDHVVW